MFIKVKIDTIGIDRIIKGCVQTHPFVLCFRSLFLGMTMVFLSFTMIRLLTAS